MCSEEYFEMSFEHSSSNYYFAGRRTVGFDCLNLVINYPKILGLSAQYLGSDLRES